MGRIRANTHIDAGGQSRCRRPLQCGMKLPHFVDPFGMAAERLYDLFIFQSRLEFRKPFRIISRKIALLPRRTVNAVVVGNTTIIGIAWRTAVSKSMAFRPKL